MSSINTIAIETTPVVLAVATKPKPVVQRKKKTFPVVARCEGVEDESIPEPSIADTLLNIIQTKPDIKAPAPAIRKKKAISVADVIGSVIDAPKPVKKTTKKDKTPDAVAPAPTSVEVAIPVQTEILGEPSSETVVPEPAPKAIKKRAPKKKAEVVIQGPVLENVESTLENNQIQEPLGENAETVVPEPAPKVVKKRAPKKKAEVVIQGPVLENVESLENNQIQEPLGEIAQTVVVVPEPAPKVVKKRAPKKKAEVVIQGPVLENIESLENNQIQEPLGENAETVVVVPEPAPKVVKKRAPKKKAEVVIPEPVLENIESTLENNQIQEPLGENAETVVPEPAPKAIKKRAPKKKAEVVIQGPVLENVESLENNQIQEPLGEIAQTVVVVPEPAPKVVKKRAPKKKAEVVIPGPVLENIESLENNQIQEPLGEIAQTVLENIESLENNQIQETLGEIAEQLPIQVVPEPAPKVVKKRAPKKKAEVVIPGPVLENIESTLENNQIQEPLGENAETVVVPEPAPKAIKKRAPKKKVEVVIPQPVLENIESNTFDLTTIQDALGEIAFSYDGKPSTASINTLDTKNPMEWFDEQAKQIDLRREPILNTFFVPVPELDEELYQLNTNTLYNNSFAYEDKSSTTALLTATLSIPQTPTLVLAEQPIYDGLSNIIANTLENEDYSDEIMVETLEFNGQTYWIDAHHNVLDKETFAHIGLYKPETATIVFY
jgi:hypothetical protein